MGKAIEEIFSGQISEEAPLLAYHFQQAGDDQRALQYYTIAAENAARLYANEEAVNHYSKALEIGDTLTPDDITLAQLYHGRGPISEVLGDFDGARNDLETALKIARRAGDDLLVWHILLDLGNLWTSRDYSEAGDYYEKALDLARSLADHQILARSLNRVGNWNANAEHPQQAITFHREALEIIEQLDDPPGLANTLDLLGMANLLAGNFKDAHHYFDRAVALYRELDDRFRLAGSLSTRRAGVTYNDLTIAQPPKVLQAAALSAGEALKISKGIGWLAGESFALWVLSLNTALLGEFGEALAMVDSGLTIATEINHRQWMAGHEFVYGVLYCDILATHKAQGHAERAFELARETGSQYWTNQAAGALARAYLLQDDLVRCRNILSSVLSPSTPLDSHAKRYCWLHRAELALAEGEPELALDIIARLVANTPGLTGNVIPYLWRLHAEALVVIGKVHEAKSIIQFALESVPAGHPQRWRLYAVLGDLYWQTDRQTAAEEAYTAGRADVVT